VKAIQPGFKRLPRIKQGGTADGHSVKAFPYLVNGVGIVWEQIGTMSERQSPETEKPLDF
jgi:hypothetical protein